MKTLKTLTATFLIVLSITAFANDDTNNRKFKMDYALTTYIDAISHGKVQGVAEVLDTEVKFTLVQGQKILNYDRQEMLNFIKGLKNIQQNCKTNYQLVDVNATQAVVKISQQYDSFNKVSIVSMANTTKGWKITNVTSSFE
ncbi:nuclear transport factor 2 family protein [Pedobacter sp. SYSU D00535]|uniref:nuclear transport factor 2 family protein n=1 Tax=Pedobacter sp. SYSU D00535 TaxID=2810308 RepID=UPI001F6171E6|nr:nuclear transport factor 2 family protein [Pedobacter sp. SYSU D00535]